MVIFNTIVFMLVTRVIFKHKRTNQKNQRDMKSVIKTVISIFSLMSVFGIFWLLGAANVYQAAVFVQWPFILLNVSQGIILFVFFVVIDAHNQWRNLLTCNKYTTKPHFPVITSHSKAASKKTSEMTTGSRTLSSVTNDCENSVELNTSPRPESSDNKIDLSTNLDSEPEDGFTTDPIRSLTTGGPDALSEMKINLSYSNPNVFDANTLSTHQMGMPMQTDILMQEITK